MNDIPPRAVRDVLAGAIASRVTPGGVITAGTAAGPVYTVAGGRVAYAADAAAVEPSTIYDLASLTKVMATTPLALRGEATGQLPLETPLASRLAEFAAHDAITVQDLLEHTAGFPAHRPYYRAVAGRAGYLARIAAEPAAYPPGTMHLYTDLGFILLGVLIEEAFETSLSSQFDHFVNTVLPGAELAFGARPEWRPRIAPSGVDPWRGRVIAGRVHDSNAAALGGAAGHAGLFGTADGVGAFACWWLGLAGGGASVSYDIPAALAARAAARGTVPGSSRGLGWDTMLPTSSCGTRMSSRAFGHTGYTGTSLWIDPARDLYVVCLTNRVHASEDSEGIRLFRRALHDAVVDAWDATR